MTSIRNNKIAAIFIIAFSLWHAMAYCQTGKGSEKIIFGQKSQLSTESQDEKMLRCASTEYEKFLQEKNAGRMSSQEFEAWLVPLVSKYKAMRSSSKAAATIITIPVVFHIIHSGQAVGTAPNITDAQIQSQITVLNQDFRKMTGTPGGTSTNPVAADIEIEFALANVDPNGNPTNGIDRRLFCMPSWSQGDIEGMLKPTTIWNPNLYLNIWSVELTNPSIFVAYAQFPNATGAASLPGLPSSGGLASTDGIVANYNFIGTNAYNDGSFLLQQNYAKGRTITHEIGHWLGLRHIWGDTTCGNDYCADTPVHHDANFSCPVTNVSCNAPTLEMVQNYMDYTNDTCMDLFTLDQKDRMTTIINNAARRSSLKTSDKHLPIPLFANDAEIKIEASCAEVLCGAVSSGTNQYLTINNRGTSNLTSATIQYVINGTSNYTYNWIGNLATNKSATFSVFINATSNGTIAVTGISAVNGTTDQRLSNNTASSNFILPVSASNYDNTKFDFNLQQDLWGDEISWTLKNSAGATLYSGGPYSQTTTLPSLLSYNWVLPNNDCYTFTINDSQGDGICCDGGNGYYEILTNNGAVVVKYGNAYSSSDKVLFTNNVLNTNQWEGLNVVNLYPNPTKGILNISIPNGFGLPTSISIQNNLGQTLIKKSIRSESDLSINTMNLSKGVYYLTVVKDLYSKTFSFIRN